MHVLECLSDCTTFVIAQFTTFCLRIMTFQLPLFWITLYSTAYFTFTVVDMNIPFEFGYICRDRKMLCILLALICHCLHKDMSGGNRDVLLLNKI